MSADLRRVKSIFVEAIEKSGCERASYLDRACGSDVGLRAEVEGLLNASERTSALVGGRGALCPTPDGIMTDDGVPAIAEVPGSRIGHYKVLQQIGHGGFGVVFMAEQEQPVRRKVALKVIKLGMDTRQVIARFEAERQALAMMDHPNIAKVLDAGGTDSGRPYFVMELVNGVPLTEFCDENQLTMRERLELFVPVCQAVQHAHQKGIIHRDLKPSNVLVTLHDDKPVPKVIDFGIAKATQTPLTDRTLFTEFKQFMGTPQYTSPEQAQMSGLDIDTRADVYSLGVILYELLTGTTPLDPGALRSAALEEVQRMIRQIEPPRPSTRLSTLAGMLATVAAHRKADPKRLPRMVRGELDWIVLKCLEKDRTRRYETASGLAADVRRYLEDEPVLARPATASYRARKFIRRHKAGVATSAALLVFLLLGSIGTTLGLIRARAAERGAVEERRTVEKLLEDVRAAKQDALREARRAKGAVDFLEKMLSSAWSSDRRPHSTAGNPMGAGRSGRDVMIVDILDEAARELDRLPGDSEVEFDARIILGTTYDALGLEQQAKDQLEQARELALRLYGPQSDVTLGATADLVRMLARMGHIDRAEAVGTEALAVARRAFGAHHYLTCRLHNSLGVALLNGRRYAEAEAIFQSLVTKARTQRGKLDHYLPSWLNNLAVALRSQGHHEQAAALLMEVMDLLKQRDEPILRGHARRNLALALAAAGRLDEAEAAYREALSDQRRILEDDHPSTLTTATQYATLLDGRGKTEQAASLRQELRLPAASHPATMPGAPQIP